MEQEVQLNPRFVIPAVSQLFKMIETEETNYSDFHRKFLRCVTAKGCIELPTAQRYFEELKHDFPDSSSETLDSTIALINNSLCQFEQQVSKVKHEQLNQEFLVFSTIAPIPEIISLQKFVRPNDIKYFEAVIKALLTTDDYQLRFKIAMGMEVPQVNRKPGENNKMLLNWIKLGYFTDVDGTLLLGPKSLVELKGYIRSEFPQIRSCALCLMVTFLNLSCPNCQKSFHQPCLQRYWQSMPNSCPSCRTRDEDWNLEG